MRCVCVCVRRKGFCDSQSPDFGRPAAPRTNSRRRIDDKVHLEDEEEGKQRERQREWGIEEELHFWPGGVLLRQPKRCAADLLLSAFLWRVVALWGLARAQNVFVLTPLHRVPLFSLYHSTLFLWLCIFEGKYFDHGSLKCQTSNNLSSPARLTVHFSFFTLWTWNVFRGVWWPD